MRKINFRDKEKWRKFLNNNENKIMIVVLFSIFLYWVISSAIPNFWVGILIYYLIYLGLCKLYDLLLKYFFASGCK